MHLLSQLLWFLMLWYKNFEIWGFLYLSLIDWLDLEINYEGFLVNRSCILDLRYCRFDKPSIDTLTMSSLLVSSFSLLALRKTCIEYDCIICPFFPLYNLHNLFFMLPGSIRVYGCPCELFLTFLKAYGHPYEHKDVSVAYYQELTTSHMVVYYTAMYYSNIVEYCSTDKNLWNYLFFFSILGMLQLDWVSQNLVSRIEP